MHTRIFRHYLFRFKLNHNSNRLLPGERNFSIWVGDLSPEIDDLQLYRFFSARFKTIVSAKGKDQRSFISGFFRPLTLSYLIPLIYNIHNHNSPIVFNPFFPGF